MAVGDVVGGLANLEVGETLSIQPSSGIEWIVHNIYHGTDIQLIIAEGANELIVESDTGSGAYLGYWFHLSNTHYLKVKNSGSGAALFGYDGIVSKAS